MIVAAGCPSIMTPETGRTPSIAGAAPMVHCICALLTTGCPILSPFYNPNRNRSLPDQPAAHEPGVTVQQ